MRCLLFEPIGGEIILDCEKDEDDMPQIQDVNPKYSYELSSKNIFLEAKFLQNMDKIPEEYNVNCDKTIKLRKYGITLFL